MDGLNYELKDITWQQRVELNNMITSAYSRKEGWMTYMSYALTCGLKTLNGVTLNSGNIETEINKLGNEQIAEIANEIVFKANHVKKKDD